MNASNKLITIYKLCQNIPGMNLACIYELFLDRILAHIIWKNATRIQYEFDKNLIGCVPDMGTSPSWNSWCSSIAIND